MIARIDGEVVPLDAMWWPTMNWDQFRWEYPLGAYELKIPRKVFVDGMTTEYAHLVAELRADDEIDPDGTPYLREIGYAPLNVALDHPRQTFELIEVFLYREVFETFLPRPSRSARFMMNSVDAVTVTPAAVVVRGRGYHCDAGL